MNFIIQVAGRLRPDSTATKTAAPPELSVSGLAQDLRWGRNIVTLNRSFFDGTLPATTAQLLVMENRQAGDPLGVTPGKLGHGLFELRRGIYDSIDWNALTAIVAGAS